MGYRDQGGCGLGHQLRVLEDVADDFGSFADIVAAWYCYGIRQSITPFDSVLDSRPSTTPLLDLFPVLVVEAGEL